MLVRLHSSQPLTLLLSFVCIPQTDQLINTSLSTQQKRPGLFGTGNGSPSAINVVLVVVIVLLLGVVVIRFSITVFQKKGSHQSFCSNFVKS